ncbi:uncharacterized protein L203_105848 [Cryptococcus depauperatus CBS 7841]|uniref:Telomere-associated protein Rif1 N-terminal domain-containing protein n=1 Tax=Cryptococcus depauperatus CBS 7841 TaxID=1295531 RepID=A0AAJ8JY39_9TREE
MSTSSCVSFSQLDYAVDNPIASCSTSTPLVATSSSPTKPSQIVPLGATRVSSAVGRRTVNFSPKNDTKYFDSDECPSPVPTAELAFLSNNQPLSDSASPQGTPTRQSRCQGSPMMRSILKSRAEQILIAETVEEGTLNNREPARLVISGKRPSLVARDSIEFAMVIATAESSSNHDRKGKDNVNEVSSSDGVASSDSSSNAQGDSDNEKSDEMEKDGALATESLVDIILNGTEDLLTLEEAYNILTLRLRQRIPVDEDVVLTPLEEDDIRAATQPIRDEAPAMVRAMQRDILRLLGKPPSSEPAMNHLETPPFRDLIPLSPLDQSDRLSPPLTDTISSPKSPSKTPRQGYTESEIRYRREAAGVGAAVLRLLAFTFHSPQLYSCFSDVDLQTLLNQVLCITRVSKLPTPNPKKTCFLCIVLLGQMRLPAAVIGPLKEKVVKALVKAVMEEFRLKSSGTLSDKSGPNGTRRDGLNAIQRLLTIYPTLFFPFYAELLPGCIKAAYNPSLLIRFRAGAALCAFARAKITCSEQAQESGSQVEWAAARIVNQKAEFFVISHLKSCYINANTTAPTYGKDGKKQTEWSQLEEKLKIGVGEQKEVHWACSTWASIVTLIGSAYAQSSLSWNLEYIMDRSMRLTTNTVRPLLARVAWNHAIHAYMLAGSTVIILDDGRIIKTYQPFTATSDKSILQLIASIQIPIRNSLDEALKAQNCTMAKTESAPGKPSHYFWMRSEKTKKLSWLTNTALSATALLFAYIGTALYSEDLPAKDLAVLSGLPSSDADADDGVAQPTVDQKQRPRLDQTWQKVYPILQNFFALRGLDNLITYSWDLLNALTSASQLRTPWTLNTLIHTAYLDIDACDVDKESELPSLMDHFKSVGLQPKDIPSFGQSFVAFRMGKWISLFRQALLSVHGLNKSDSAHWIKTEDGAQLIPTVLSDVWLNLLNALSTVNSAPGEENQAVYRLGVGAVTELILQVWRKHPRDFMPINMIDSDNRCLIDEDGARVEMTSYLLKMTIQVLGEEWLTETKLWAEKDSDLEYYMVSAFHVDADKQLCVPAGVLLGQLLRTDYLSAPTRDHIKIAYMKLIRAVWNPAFEADGWKRLLGNITKSAPFLFVGNEELQMTVWRLIAMEWINRIDRDTSSSQNNHTGNLLVSLLSCPFRNINITSKWHQSATSEDLSCWKLLLEKTVYRFRKRKAVVHTGVLETLAAHLVDFLEQGEGTINSKSTLQCLSAATSYICFRSSSNCNQSSPWAADDNRPPTDFLELINNTLQRAYVAKINSDDVKDLLNALRVVVDSTPPTVIPELLEPLEGGLTVWSKDQDSVVRDDLSQAVENLNLTIFAGLSGSPYERTLFIDAQRLTSLLETHSFRARTSQQYGQALYRLLNNTLEAGSAQKSPNKTIALSEVLDFLIMYFTELNVENIEDLLLPIPQGLVAWLRNTDSLATTGVTDKLDGLYAIILKTIARVIPSHIPANSSNLNNLLPLYSSRAATMPKMFSAFWSQTFSGVEGLKVEEETKAFLEEMSETGEDIIDVAGLCSYGQLRETQAQENQSSQSEAVGNKIQNRVATHEDNVKLCQEVDISYDADESQVEAQTQTQPVDANRITTVSTELAIPASLPLLTENASPSMEEDVFGLACLTIPRKERKPRKKPKRRQDIAIKTPALETRSTKLAKRQKTIASEVPHAVSPLVEASDEEECIVVQPEPEYYIRKGLTPPLLSSYPEYMAAKTFEQHQEFKTNTKTDKASVNAHDNTVLASGGTQIVSTSPVQFPSANSDEPSGLLSSAGRWLAKVPSLSFFGNTPHMKRHDSEVSTSVSDSASHPNGERFVEDGRYVKKQRKRKAVEQSESPKRLRLTTSMSSSSCETKRRLVPVVELPSRDKSMVALQREAVNSIYKKNTGKGEIKQTQEESRDDEEDELLLSPESARKHQEEEVEGLRSMLTTIPNMQGGNETTSRRQRNAPHNASPKRVTSVLHRVQSAPSSQSFTSFSQSPDCRTNQQITLIDTLQTAVQNKVAIESMDYEGTKLLLKYIKELRDSAEKRLEAKTDEIWSLKPTKNGPSKNSRK